MNHMAAAVGRHRASCAAQVCTTCKLRKKRCDKSLPRCGYCIRKGFKCGYASRPPDNSIGAPSRSVSSCIPSQSTLSEACIYQEAHVIIRSTGQFVDDVTTRYFQGIHRWLPFVSRTRFHDSLITLGGPPSAGFSALLLSVCLVALSPKLGSSDGSSVDQRALYTTTKGFFARVQGVCPPSVALIQAGLLLALYEYAHGRPDNAFTSVGGCARMGYTARIHGPAHGPTSGPDTAGLRTGIDTRAQLEAEEAANTWWGVILCERIFYAEVSVPDQPLLISFPDADARLPTEAIIMEQSPFRVPDSKSGVNLSQLNSAEVGPFGRTAQAAWLLDQVLKTIEVPAIDHRLSGLRNFDSLLQSHLRNLIQHRPEARVIHCEAIAITIRALFALHENILDQPENVMKTGSRTLAHSHEYSHAALDTATQMIIDIADARDNSGPHLFACVPPSYSHIIRVAIKYIHERNSCKDDGWLSNAEERLRTALDRFNQY